MDETSQNIDVSIIIVSYNNTQILYKTLTSISDKLRECIYEIIVVDNASTAGNAEMIHKNFPNIQLIQNSHNVGFGAACNIGVQSATSENILFLNSDIILLENPIPELVKLLRTEPNIGIVGCQLLNNDGTLQPSYYRFPRLWLRFLQLTNIKKLILFLFPELRFQHKASIFTVDFVSGAFLFMRRDLFLLVQGFDTDYFMYTEDADLCFKIKKINYNIVVVNRNFAIHLGEHYEGFDNIFVWEHANKGILLFFKKHYSFLKVQALIILSLPSYVFSLIYILIIKKDVNTRSSILKVMLFYLRNLISPKNSSFNISK